MQISTKQNLSPVELVQKLREGKYLCHRFGGGNLTLEFDGKNFIMDSGYFRKEMIRKMVFEELREGVWMLSPGM